MHSEGEHSNGEDEQPIHPQDERTSNEDQPEAKQEEEAVAHGGYRRKRRTNYVVDYNDPRYIRHALLSHPLIRQHTMENIGLTMDIPPTQFTEHVGYGLDIEDRKLPEFAACRVCAKHIRTDVQRFHERRCFMAHYGYEPRQGEILKSLIYLERIHAVPILRFIGREDDHGPLLRSHPGVLRF